MCVCEGGGGRRKRRRRRHPGYRIKNKNPTQRCGEKGKTVRRACLRVNSPPANGLRLQKPPILGTCCQAMAAKVALQLQRDGAHCAPPCFALQRDKLQTLRATTDTQPRKGLPPMVSEFLEIKQHLAKHPLPPLSRSLSTPSQGYLASAINNLTAETITIGIHRNPEQFVQEALKIGHPTRLHSLFPAEMRTVVDHCAKDSRCPGQRKNRRAEKVGIHGRRLSAS